MSDYKKSARRYTVNLIKAHERSNGTTDKCPDARHLCRLLKIATKVGLYD